PERVSELIMPSAMLAGPSTVDWLYRDLGRVFPEAWDRFRRAVPEDGELLLAYSRLMEDPDPEVRSAAASEWLRWEETAISLEPNNGSGLYSTIVGDAQIAFVRICAHIFGHRAWLAEGQLIRDAGRLAGIPGVVIQGRHDLSCPVQPVW